MSEVTNQHPDSARQETHLTRQKTRPARKKKGRLVNGWLVLDKPENIGSTPAVGAVKRYLDARKAGHAGTLDPFASGILPIALGTATRTIPYLVESEKHYTFTLRFGLTTDTLDRDGEVQDRCDSMPSASEVEAILPRFIGEIDQRPPDFAAVKVDGQRAYDLARQGIALDLQPRPVTITALELLHMDGAQATLHCQCGKGMYVRALARDLAHALGSLAMVEQLRRTRVGPFDLESAIGLEELSAIGHREAPLLPVSAGLDGIPVFALTPAEAGQLKRGGSISLMRKMDEERIAGLCFEDDILASLEGTAIAICHFAKGLLKPVRQLS